jgi:hypothetical protein
VAISGAIGHRDRTGLLRGSRPCRLLTAIGTSLFESPRSSHLYPVRRYSVQRRAPNTVLSDLIHRGVLRVRPALNLIDRPLRRFHRALGRLTGKLRTRWLLTKGIIGEPSNDK